LVTIFGDYDQGTFSLWDKFDPWGTSWPLGARGEVKNGPLTACTAVATFSPRTNSAQRRLRVSRSSEVRPREVDVLRESSTLLRRFFRDWNANSLSGWPQADPTTYEFTATTTSL
jgi:hypothetical protein